MYKLVFNFSPQTVYKCDFLNLQIQDLLSSRQDCCCMGCKEANKAIFFKKSSPVKDSASDEKHAASLTKEKLLLEASNLTLMQSEKRPSTTANLGPENSSTAGTMNKVRLEEFLKQGKEVQILPSGIFHIIVFSLLLSYFPSAVQRWECCRKAHRLLCTNGILLIVTPDSSHQNKNSAMIKSWKTGIESLGFVRWKYLKHTHLHCMAFRKVAPCHSYNHGNGSAEMMYIPQDFQEEEDEDGELIVNLRSEEDDCGIAEWLSELTDL